MLPKDLERVLPEKTQNSEALASFTRYCRANPNQRFWQALRNWSKYRHIIGIRRECETSKLPPGFETTWYHTGLEGSAEHETEQVL